MSSNDTDQDLLKRLRDLEEENARLRSSSRPSTLKVTEGDYKGFPTLTFEGPFRPFTLGLTKLRTIKEAWPLIEDFLRRHTKTKTDSMQKNDNIKI